MALQYYPAFDRQKKALETAFGAWLDENHPELVSPEDSSKYISAVREADHDRLKQYGLMNIEGLEREI